MLRSIRCYHPGRVEEANQQANIVSPPYGQASRC